jgi:hypothetical protein
MCALHKGGTRKLKERYELYFNLGVDVLSGADNWGDSLASETAPHEKPSATVPPQEKLSTPPHENHVAGYKRWKPE